MFLKKENITKKEGSSLHKKEKSCVKQELKSKSTKKSNSKSPKLKEEFKILHKTAEDIAKIGKETAISKKKLVGKKEVVEEKSSLQSVVEALLFKQLEDQTLDFQIKNMGFDPALTMGAYVIDPEISISYGALFSYLSGNAKENPYLNYFETKRKEKEEKEKKETNAKELSYEKITKFMISGRLKIVTGVESYEATPFLREKYEYFKIFNQAYSFLLYQMLR
ncbi:MAG: hypothetical protein KAQ83_01245 [Nanoarchaeota archaeon]|nr:hypothetical protein [Nanoarchaeota archaeon]